MDSKPRPVAALVEATTESSPLPLACTEARPCPLASAFTPERLAENHTGTIRGWTDEFPAVQQGDMQRVSSKVYTPLFPWQTRVIQLDGATHFDDRLVCQLYVADLVVGRGVGIAALGRVVEYLAISYSWGYPDFTCSITCNGIQFPITRHLSEALRFFRQERAQFFWIDAFCINQYDPTEKSRQVENMLLIFQKAVLVQAWLGLSGGGDKGALEACGALAKRLPKARFGLDPLDELRLWTEDLNRDYITVRTLLGCGVCQDHLIRCQKGFAALMKRYQWWRRTWVRQEVFAAPNLTLHTDSWSMSWSEFQDIQNSLLMALEKAFDRYVRAFVDSVLLQELQQLEKRRGAAISNGDGRGYLSLMINASESECMKACDKVYGVIGIIEGCKATDHSTDNRAVMFPIDYTLSDAQVYATFIKHTIKRTRSFDMLCVFENRLEKSKIADLPSWVPDFSTKRLRAFYKLDAAEFSTEYGHAGSAFGNRSVDKVIEDVCKWNELPVISFEIGEIIDIFTLNSPNLQHPSERDMAGHFTSFSVHTPSADPRYGYNLEGLQQFLLQDFGFTIAKVRVECFPRCEKEPGQDTPDVEMGLLAPSNTQIGDLVVLPDAMRLPIVIRRSTKFADKSLEQAGLAYYSHVGLCVAGRVIWESSGKTSFVPYVDMEELLKTVIAGNTRYHLAKDGFEKMAQEAARLLVLH